MSLPREIDNYIKESIDHCLGLPVSTNTLELKLIASESAQHRLHAQCLSLQSKLNQQILATKSSRAEAKLNAQALKKAIERTEQLTEENSRLINQCKKWKVFANRGKMSLNRAKEAEIRVRELEQEVKRLTEDLNFFKHQHQMRKFHFSSMEEVLVESALAHSIGETESSVDEFLLANIGHESCRRLLHLSKSLKPPTLRALSLAAKIRALEKNKQQLEIRLSTVQGEAKLLSDQIGYLLEDQTSPSHEERGQHYSGGKPPARGSSASMKLYENKRGREQCNSED